MSENKKRNIVLITIAISIGILSGFGFYNANKDNSTEEIVSSAVNEIKDYTTTYNMTQEEIEQLPSTEITEQTEAEEQEVSAEQEVEAEGFELQGEIAYEGDKANTWNVELGDYVGLTYYNQTDSRWRNHIYSSVGDSSQTIGTSGCGPTSAAMVVTATRGAITPDQMGDLFVQYGYRSANSGTYWSAFRAVADEFNIGYTETTDIQRALQLLESNHYVVASVGNGLFTTGGHFIVLIELNGDTITVYDPYLYAGKFDTSTRRGKVTVDGNKVYVSVSNFINYANTKGFFCYEHDGSATENTGNVTTSTYTRYVKTNTGVGVNVRTGPSTSNAKVGALADGTLVTIYETSGSWSRIGTNRWVCSNYLVSTYTSSSSNNTAGQTRKTKACYLYSNANLTGTRYSYKANTTVTILSNVSSSVDRVRVNATGRYAYISTSNYTSSGSSNYSNGTAGQYKRLANRTYLYSNSNLTGTRYTYLPLTQVKIIRNVSSSVDYVYVVKTGRYAYVRSNSYR